MMFWLKRILLLRINFRLWYKCIIVQKDETAVIKLPISKVSYSSLYTPVSSQNCHAWALWGAPRPSSLPCRLPHTALCFFSFNLNSHYFLPLKPFHWAPWNFHFLNYHTSSAFSANAHFISCLDWNLLLCWRLGISPHFPQSFHCLTLLETPF